MQLEGSSISISIIDIFTAITALIAAIAAVYNVVVTQRSSEKGALLSYYTSERLKDNHELKKCSSILLDEASFAVHGIGLSKDTEERIRRIIESTNEYSFILKAVYPRDEQTLKILLELKNALIAYYNSSNKETDKEHYIGEIKEKGKQFRIRSFLYIHSSWACIKRQILYGEQSQYREFNKTYTENEKKITELMSKPSFEELWSV